MTEGPNDRRRDLLAQMRDRVDYLECCYTDAAAAVGEIGNPCAAQREQIAWAQLQDARAQVARLEKEIGE